MKYPSMNRRAARVNLILLFFKFWSGRTRLMGPEANGEGSRNRWTKNRWTKLVADFRFKVLRAGLEVIKSGRGAILFEFIDISKQNRGSPSLTKSTPLEMKNS